MGRPRTFDEAAIVERAGRTFWAKGYAATSITDLEAATGLAKGSLYKAFKDKHTLFQLALQRYLTAGCDRLRRCIEEAPTGAEAVAAWIRQAGKMGIEGPQGGCFGTNSTVERGRCDLLARERLLEHERQIERLYALAIARGIEDKSFRQDLDPDEGARYLSSIVHGVQVLSRSSLDTDQLESIVKLTLRALA